MSGTLGTGTLGSGTLGDPSSPGWQIVLRGLTMGDGTAYLFGEDGPEWIGGVDLRVDDTARPQAHGVASPGPDWAATKTLTVPFLIAGSADTAIGLVEDLAAAWAPAEAPEWLELQTPLRRYLLHGKPRRFAAPASWAQARGVLEPVAAFELTDPRLYGEDLRSATATTGEETDGLGYPHGYPHGYGTVIAGTVEVANRGTADSYPVVTISAGAAELVDPSIELVTSGERLAFELTVPAGWHLIVDMDARTVLLTASLTDLSGAASRANAVDRPGAAWWSIPPGTHTVRFGGAGEYGTATITWRDAWWL